MGVFIWSQTRWLPLTSTNFLSNPLYIMYVFSELLYVCVTIDQLTIDFLCLSSQFEVSLQW